MGLPSREISHSSPPFFLLSSFSMNSSSWPWRDVWLALPASQTVLLLLIMSSSHMRRRTSLLRHVGKSQTRHLQGPFVRHFLSSPRTTQTSLSPELSRLPMLQNNTSTKNPREFSNGKTSKITKDLNYLSIIGKVHQIAEKWSFSFSPGLLIKMLSASNPRNVMRPIPNELNPSNWKQPCLVFGLGYFHHWTIWAKT